MWFTEQIISRARILAAELQMCLALTPLASPRHDSVAAAPNHLVTENMMTARV